MTRTVEGIRFAGDIVVMVFGACFHQLSLIVAGLAVVIIAWCSGWFGKMLES